MPFFVWRFAALLACAAPAAASTVGGAPLIPEPMVFDMIRPLAAPRGELEANTLGLFPLASPGEEIDWAPEIEYALFDGYAVELELPFANGRLQGVKIGLQGTFGTLADNAIVHGWQYLGVVDRDNGKLESSLLYIVGARWNERWSSLTMVGINRPGAPVDRTLPRDNALLINHSVFREMSSRTTAGVEVNWRTSSRQANWLLMPQLHQRLSPQIMVQAGAGLQKPARRAAHPSLALRMIKEF